MAIGPVIAVAIQSIITISRIGRLPASTNPCARLKAARVDMPDRLCSAKEITNSLIGENIVDRRRFCRTTLAAGVVTAIPTLPGCDRPALIARCMTSEDVAHAVTFARERDLLVAVRGGGHSWPGKSVCDDGLMIDLALMNTVNVNPEARRAHARGGALLMGLDVAALEHGLVTTASVVSHTGVGGFTLSGSIVWPVEQARDVQRERFKESGFFCNSEMGPAEVWKFCQLDDGAKGLLQTATQRLNLSARAFHRILKVSRTIADLEGSEGINIAHLAEALQYRPRTAVS